MTNPPTEPNQAGPHPHPGPHPPAAHPPAPQPLAHGSQQLPLLHIEGGVQGAQLMSLNVPQPHGPEQPPKHLLNKPPLHIAGPANAPAPYIGVPPGPQVLHVPGMPPIIELGCDGV
jgi:hypothetical protein